MTGRRQRIMERLKESRFVVIDILILESVAAGKKIINA